MKKQFNVLFFFCVLVGLGMSMPRCPGQQAIQQQLDLMQVTHQEYNKKIQTLTSQVTTLNSEMQQVKQLLPQMTNVIQAQKTSIDQLSATVKELQTKSKSNKRSRR